jgi:hypothetical protein
VSLTFSVPSFSSSVSLCLYPTEEAAPYLVTEPLMESAMDDRLIDEHIEVGRRYGVCCLDAAYPSENGVLGFGVAKEFLPKMVTLDLVPLARWHEGRSFCHGK